MSRQFVAAQSESTNWLLPDAASLVIAAIMLVGFVVFVLVPILQAFRQQAFGWAAVCLLLPPVGGMAWWLLGRTSHAPSRAV
ncbi:MAG: hypothetical protein WAW88_03115 [Nocardioides sp.]